ncbi:protein shisa-5-like [Syngnathoides biaculeatus]|uniref:protein shisa-5-like n=1 Tax=Syngnathoides biaculeatus TaxID=300417 RepID=UPI002ADDEFBE|nr:protein shisa-5-like [Syngnathoides biaculeatus]
MVSGLSVFFLLALLCATLTTCVSLGDNDCLPYTDAGGMYHHSERCLEKFCCGSCTAKHCCNMNYFRFTKESQEDCVYDMFVGTTPVLGSVIGTIVLVVVVLISCCVCPCCCLYKMCRKPRPVIATTTHTTVVSTNPQHYPQQPTMSLGQPQPYQGAPYPAYQPVPVQSGYGAQPVPPQGYPPQSMPTLPHPGQPFTHGPPPTYQEATGPAYPPNPTPYSQAAFTPGQSSYPLQPPVQPPMQPLANAPAAQVDYLAQPAYNPDYVSPPPKMG